MPRTLVAGVLGVAVAGFLLVAALPNNLFGRVPAMTGMVDAPAAGVAVVDGHTLRLHDAVIRLQGVESPPRGTPCLRPDGGRYDCGAAASAALARLLHGRDVVCRLYGRDEAGFPQGQCEANGLEVNRAIVAAGWARARDEVRGLSTASLASEESQARAAGRGLWTGGNSF